MEQKLHKKEDITLHKIKVFVHNSAYISMIIGLIVKIMISKNYAFLLKIIKNIDFSVNL